MRFFLEDLLLSCKKMWVVSHVWFCPICIVIIREKRIFYLLSYPQLTNWLFCQIDNLHLLMDFYFFKQPFFPVIVMRLCQFVKICCEKVLFQQLTVENFSFCNAKVMQIFFINVFFFILSCNYECVIYFSFLFVLFWYFFLFLP